MDWNHQLSESLQWLGEAFAVSGLGAVLLILALGRFTEWGRQVRRITWQYFNPFERKLPLALLGTIVLMTLFAVRMNVLFSYWYNGFYSAMQNLDAKAFWFMLLVFGTLATVHVGRALLAFYLQQVLAIRWRVWLTKTLVERWLSKQSYYRSQFVGGQADNPDQRIQQDVESFVSGTLSLSMGLLDAIVSLVAFSIILWGLSGALTVFGLVIPRAMVFMVYLYVIVATVFALRIGRPLITLNFLSEQLGANFRYALVRLREYGESIAFYRGESAERDNLLNRFGRVIDNAWNIVFRSLKFQGFNLAISQTAVVFPFIIQAPRLLSKQIGLGDVMQTAQSFDQVQSALSFFRSSYENFASYRAVITRLTGFLDTMELAEQLGHAQFEQAVQGLKVESLTVETPTHVVLVKCLDLALVPQSSLLIVGKSGVGKTTLLRALAGLWPYTDGRVLGPAVESSLFLPQKPYLPLGSLRTALYYPAVPQTDGNAEMVLGQCHLAHLVDQLDVEQDWTGILSLGEQQRLAIGRVLLNRPSLVILDEASSAMDEGLELNMYQLLRNCLPDAILVSVGHRSSLRHLHTQTLELLGDGNWRLQPFAQPPDSDPTNMMDIS